MLGRNLITWPRQQDDSLTPPLTAGRVCEWKAAARPGLHPSERPSQIWRGVSTGAQPGRRQRSRFLSETEPVTSVRDIGPNLLLSQRKMLLVSSHKSRPSSFLFKRFRGIRKNRFHYCGQHWCIVGSVCCKTFAAAVNFGLVRTQPCLGSWFWMRDTLRWIKGGQLM